MAGVPVSLEASAIPREHSAATYSKCAVCFLITVPKQMIVSYLCEIPSSFAIRGISNAPGTQKTAMRSSDFKQIDPR